MQLINTVQTTLYALLLILCKLLGGKPSVWMGSYSPRLERLQKLSREDIAFRIVVKPKAGASERHTVQLAKANILKESGGVEPSQLDASIESNTEMVVRLRARKEILEITRVSAGLSRARLLCHGILDPDGLS